MFMITKKIIRDIFSAGVFLALFGGMASEARAGDIVGKAGGSGTPGADCVVWVDGIEAPPASTEPLQISQKGVQFKPSFLVAVKGQLVNMPNDDDVAHNVFSYSPAKKFNLGIYPKGESRSVTFDQTGLVDIFCSIHRNMNAKVFVVPNRYYAQSKIGDSYVIGGVPAGNYHLKMWVKDVAEQSQDVTVPESGKATVDFA